VDDQERRLRLENLYVEYAADVFAYARRRADAVSAEDVVMEVFVIACRRLEDVPDPALAWLLGCARRTLANQRRGTRRSQALVKRLSREQGEQAAGSPVFELLWTALALLSDSDREVLLLSAWEELTPLEIAQVVGCTRTAAKVRLYRARRRLAEAMKPVSGVGANGSPEAEVAS
jgi:RNA polymerase sigma factor (sigma-70 family)